MNNTKKLDSLRKEYFDLSKEFISALNSNRSSSELEQIRNRIRDILDEIQIFESAGNQKEKDTE